MKRLFAIALLSGAAAGIAAPAHAADVNLNVYSSWRQMNDTDLWEDLEDQYSLGGMVDFAKAGSPLHFVVGTIVGVGAKDFTNPLINDAISVENELSFGINKTWGKTGSTRPFLSGGVSFVRTEITLDAPGGDIKDDDDSLGFFVEGGVYWRLGPHFNLGLHGRILGGTSVEMFGEEGDADYWEAGPMIGWSWPAKR